MNNDAIDIIIYQIANIKDHLGDKYNLVMETIKKSRALVSGTGYIRKKRTKWEEVRDSWEMLKNTGRPKKEIYETIATQTDLSLYSVKRIVSEIKKNSKHTKIKIGDEKTLFDMMEGKDG